MKQFLSQNKIFLAIIVAAFIIGGFVYISRPHPNVSTSTTTIPPTITSITTISSPNNCINFQDADNYIGEYKCVIGKVDNVFISSTNTTFLNFCPNYQTCPFSAVIFNSDSPKFPNPEQYENKTVEITGLIKTYQGKPEIILDEPSQIKIK